MNRAKSIFILLVSILMIAIIYWFFSVLIVNRPEFSKVKKGKIEAQNNFEKLKNERANYSTIKQSREMQIVNFDTLKLHIPLKENNRGNNTYIQTLDTIHEIAIENNVLIDIFKPILVNTFPDFEVEASLLDKSIERYIVEMQCHGDFISIGKYFQALQNHDKIINLLKFNIETEYGSAGGLFCDATLYTYVFSENN